MNSVTTSRDLGLIGAGYWGKNLARNFHALGALHTICDTSDEILSGYGADYDGVFRTEDVKAVLVNPRITKIAIAAPALAHGELAKAALLAGKDVFVEKPLALDVAQAEELVAIAEGSGRILMVGHLLHYHPCIHEVQRLLANGELGRLQYITSNRLNLGRFRREENALWSFAPHDISIILALAGTQLPEQVRCLGESFLTPGVADMTLTMMRFSGGVRAHVYVSWLNPFKEQKLTVIGSSGMLVFDDTRPWPEKLALYQNYVTWVDGRTPTPAKLTPTYLAVPEREPLREECAHFLECCLQRRPPRTDGREGVRVLQVLKAAQRSLEQEGEADTIQPAQSSPELKPDYFAHPTAIIDAGAIIGSGCKVWHFSHVMEGAELGLSCNLGQNVVVSPGVKLGRNVKVQNNVSIYTGTTVEDDVFLGPSCVLTNVSNPRSQVNRQSLYERTLIRRGATIGANATIVCGTTLGRYCFIAAGAVVTKKDVPDYALMMGSPARQVGWMSRHGHRLRPSDDGTMVCPESGLRYREAPPGVLTCLDLAEDQPLPSSLTNGTAPYRDVKAIERTCFRSLPMS